MKIKISRFNSNKKLFIPNYQTIGSSGLDLCSSSKKNININPGCYNIIPTNLVIEIPPGYEGQIRPRSGLALKYGVTVLNTPGTIDSDYRGEIGIILINFGKKKFIVKQGDRIAQLVITKIIKVELLNTNNLSHSKRGSSGYGSTGI